MVMQPSFKFSLLIGILDGVLDERYSNGYCSITFSWWPIYDRKFRGILIQSASSQPQLVRSAVVFLENSINVWTTEQHKRIEVILALKDVGTRPDIPTVMQDPWLHEHDALLLAFRRHYVIGIETHHSMILVSSHLHSSMYDILPRQTFSPMASSKQWYCRTSMAPKPIR
ncbi:hypothetical protein TNCV_2145611 [Trichonephila clavipes]|uniref:Uncharacterized protein n=1 Tax=Trichonephila clavipes TaxID=2585209 RepID=A0A8X6VRQ1_TRICX|nr:hypothetical protein TNCV_2145611 [Trichonephila clavipes]